MMKQLVLGLAVATTLAATAPADAQVYPETKIIGRTFPNPGFAARQAGESPLNPLDAPDAGNVWKPSNRDAGNLAEERWAAYAARRADAAVASAAPSKPAPWERYPHYDSLGAFVASAFR